MFDTATWIMAALATAAFAYLSWRAGAGAAVEGARAGFGLLLTFLPKLLLAFMLAGIAQVLLPRELIAGWLSDASGVRGVLIASVAGAFTPGGPFTQFPVVAAVYKMGAGVGPIAAYLTAWSVLGAHRVILWELPFLGPRLTFARVLVSLPLPILAGLATRWVLRGP
jgi:uncharacterized membrane protein YraQ (UPF0718 family)